MKPYFFYARVIESLDLPPVERHACFADLHAEALRPYLDRVRALTAEEAQCPVNVGDDSRTVAQIVGHIAEWDRFSMLGAMDILLGGRHPRTATDLTGYIRLDGQVIDFETVDEFNAYQAEQHSAWAWDDLQALALDTASSLYALFTHPDLLHAARLERTESFEKRLDNGYLIDRIGMGWDLWLMVIEHLAVDHVDELGL
ncbi:MAG: hypothetical protein K8J31_12735 [Anaerolineae bacterium]|nr:hypothetical protein [Anaerolineae bacterium]